MNPNVPIADLQPRLSALASKGGVICYAANAVSGVGGQGEFLRHMVYTMDRVPRGRVLSRRSTARRAECVDIPFEGVRYWSARALGQVPVLRRRRDLLTLLGDVDFDSRLSGHLSGVELFDGVMGQCAQTLELLNRRGVPTILTVLNTHISYLARVLTEEYGKLGLREPIFIHDRMQERVQCEIERATVIRVISEAARQSFLEQGVPAAKVEVILPGIDLDKFRPVPRRDEMFRVLAVTSIEPRKGVHYLLDAFEKAAIPGSELVIIGGTWDRWSTHMLRTYRDRSKNIHVQSANVMTDPVEDTYGRASVVVHPAIEDGFSLAVGQALACGKPVIVTRQTGAAQLVEDGREGYVLECRDVDGMVDRLRLLARDESLLRRLSEAAPKAVSSISYPDVADRIAGLYQRLI